ncbi:DUF1259 domain-containing protein [Streptomyces sp. NPDC048506]|uniref:DUF1259 domain-containing protein n=1 Tax=Streptomyces sp. NPDC048506 TaxID=3155028 RepID=UPI003416F102
MTNVKSTLRLIAATGAVLLVGACGAAGGENAGESRSTSRAEAHDTQQPLPTSPQDWSGVAEALGREGKVMGGAVYRVSFPRRDLKVTSHGVQVKPGLALSSYAAFARYGDGTTTAMGDLVVTEDELPKVTDALQKAGIDQTAVHKHLLAQDPQVWWTHFHAEGKNARKIATALKTVLDTTNTPPPAKPSTPGPIDLDTAAIDKSLGAKGTNDGGIYKFTFARTNTVTMDDKVLTPALGVNTSINFQPTGGGKAAINGDFTMTADEIQNVIKALRAGGIDIVELHSHTLTENPRLFYMHFWANDDAVKLARALRHAVDQNHVTPAS